jgi:hypothetical protein
MGWRPPRRVFNPDGPGVFLTSERRDLAAWIRAVRRCDDDHVLHGVGIQWFTKLGHTSAWDRKRVGYINARLHVIERRRAKLTARHLSQPDTQRGTEGR